MAGDKHKDRTLLLVGHSLLPFVEFKKADSLAALLRWIPMTGLLAGAARRRTSKRRPPGDPCSPLL
jgi:hypothetical protein